MGRKKTRFDWVRDAEEPVTPRVDRVSRKDKKRPADEADALTEQLIGLQPAQLAALPLEAPIVEAIEAYHAIGKGKHGAIRRQTLFIATLLRSADIEAIETALNVGGASERDDAFEVLVRWRERIVDEGNDALTAFMEDHPSADGQRIRQLASNARKGNARAKKQLMAVLREAAGL